MRFATAGIVTVVAVVLVAGALIARPGGSAPTRTTSPPPPPPPSPPAEKHARAPAFLVTLAARMAAENCDKHPTAASYVRTTRQAAEAMSGDGVDSDPPVYLVLLRGDFVDYYAHGPYRTRTDFPRGTVITFTVDAATHDSLDFGIGSGAPDLAQLGKVHDFTDELHAAPEATVPPVCSGG
jgi:hypothetical protein